ncbi:carbon-nitrogen hydrolase [Zychaea mexicana]|uniref:carbon-nitrogen hydrolase n=1 Tax=Zychaea mexicana TaxID=64656 RepID=UPI0022FF1D2F|nr:carbon-nitrogen hydrolase [Zychaea mexicana]KAI9489758.1 carbon-nitrogen hydrolase [Zychaea mexicana]
MKIACCQFTPVWADPLATIAIVDNLLSQYGPDAIDLLVLPEMALTGYVFKSHDEIQPFLEDAEWGTTVQWAKRQAQRLCSFVVVGYPQSPGYNSLCCVNPQGHLVKTYQKAFLFETDERWAAEGPGFVSMTIEGLGRVGFGICMDINPYQFKAPFDAYEFARFHDDQDTQIIVCCMAWLQGNNNNNSSTSSVTDTISYWAQRLAPLIVQNRRRVCVVACNRTGSEKGSTFAGGSSILQVGYNTPRLLNHMGSRDSGVMIVDVDIQS